ncbi:adenylate/guanylate cyclase domain-containing protein [Gordonia sp. TBRC 11910]|uniref:Adenylate/guanylate cyclase domain-containing protein n=2 Tax=Gordonia asplenii TaxID=2725283 RepID=A0A848L4W7_9ACTN|nr:adenylate/guanylate cyclase domain-containing protein [Gordonia asplenii]
MRDTVPMTDLDNLEASLIGRRRYTREQVAEQSGVPADRARQIWTSLGFPSMDDGVVAFTDADVAAVKTFAALVPETDSSTQSQVDAGARSIGQAAARLSEWQADLIAEHLADDGAPDAEQTIAALSALQDYTWRRHLAAALSRSMDSHGTTRSLLVGFADMVGYTRLTRHLDLTELTDLLTAFESATTAAVVSHGGWVIKNVGDEVMFAATDPRDGVQIAFAMQDAIHEAAQSISDMPEIRIGLAYGPVLTRFGDLYGPVVNLAARLTGVARPNTILVDDDAAAVLDADADLTTRHLRNVRVKGIPRLRPHVIRRRKTKG